MKKDKLNKSEKTKTLTARGAAQDFIRPFVMKGDILPLHPSFKLRHDTENYSAHIEGENVVLTRLQGIAVKEEFSVSDIMRDIAMEDLYSKGIADITAATAKEAYEKRLKEVQFLLKQLNMKFKNHKVIFKKNPLNWGYVGDLTRISKELKELISFMQ
ncbi:MAG: hypothetical protein HY841_07050 [Bacteroidetes bacterium]|nr:hypothetical protein [Bacteroidota bacterium]